MRADMMAKMEPTSKQSSERHDYCTQDGACGGVAIANQ